MFNRIRLIVSDPRVLLIVAATSFLAAILMLATRNPEGHDDRPMNPVRVIPQPQPFVCPKETGDMTGIHIAIGLGKQILQEKIPQTVFCTETFQKCSGKGKFRRCGLYEEKVECGKEVWLAVFDPRAKEVRPLLAVLDPKTGVLTSTFMDRGGQSYEINIEDGSKANGANTAVHVRIPPGTVVVGQKTLIRDGPGKKAATYVPYSKALDAAFPVLAQDGWCYLTRLLGKAEEVLKMHGINHSRVPREVVMNLVLIEHFVRPRIAESEVVAEIRRVLVTLGANGPGAYQHSVSGTGARGLGQFMPKTWAGLSAKFPRLVHRDYGTYSFDHDAAAVAQYLLAIDDLRVLSAQPALKENPELGKALLADPVGLGQFVAAAYNWGGPRAAKWYIAGKTGPLPDETRMYVRKYDQVRLHLGESRVKIPAFLQSHLR